MTYTINLTPYLAGILSAAALSAGLDIPTLLATHISHTTTSTEPAGTPAPQAGTTEPAAGVAEIEANMAALRAANPRPVDRRLCGTSPEPEPPAPEPLTPEDFFRKFCNEH